MPYSAEVREVEEKYRRGEMREEEEDVNSYVSAHLEEIFHFWKIEEQKLHHPLMWQAALKMRISMLYSSKKAKDRGSVNAAREIRDELHEIEKEKWYQGEKAGHDVDGNRVAEYWNETFGPGWRSHRILEYCYIVDENIEKYLEMYKAWLKDRDARGSEAVQDLNAQPQK